MVTLSANAADGLWLVPLATITCAFTPGCLMSHIWRPTLDLNSYPQNVLQHKLVVTFHAML